MAGLSFFYTRESFFSLFSCILAGIYYYYFVQRTYVEIELSPTQQTYLKVYWAKPGVPFSEKHRAKVAIDQYQKSYGFFIPDVESFDNLRIDPCQYTGKITLHSIRLTQRGFAPLEVTFPFEKLVPIHDLDTAAIDVEGLHVITSGNDSQVHFSLSRTRVGGGWPYGGGVWCNIFSFPLFYQGR